MSVEKDEEEIWQKYLQDSQTLMEQQIGQMQQDIQLKDDLIIEL
jgi:hypothetical protein